LVIAVVLVLAAVGLLFYFLWPKKETPVPPAPVVKTGPVQTVIGKSVEGRNIDAYTYGQGTRNILFVGGIHGGYEWNSVVLAYQFKDYLDANPTAIPEGMSVTVIPALNVDGVFKVVGKEGKFTAADVTQTKEESAPGRFNARGVDLNRNFDCKWKPTSMWQNKTVSAGTAAFSEPETAAFRDLILKTKPESVVFWHSQAGAVYGSKCETALATSTQKILGTYAAAGGYPAVPTFDAYEVSGAADDWLASIGIPAITVELKTHETIEWEQNLAGSLSVIQHVHSLAK
ncbi:MAG TPA: M14 family metallopeptidase, partial [Candidatus Nanoarchaeia archaeon]|nr:M14 family metallopeptidase [Candidatus Nanoarchaeia archaeon]